MDGNTVKIGPNSEAIVFGTRYVTGPDENSNVNINNNISSNGENLGPFDMNDPQFVGLARIISNPDNFRTDANGNRTYIGPPLETGLLDSVRARRAQIANAHGRLPSEPSEALSLYRQAQAESEERARQGLPPRPLRRRGRRVEESEDDEDDDDMLELRDMTELFEKFKEFGVTTTVQKPHHDECQICLQEYEIGSERTILPCIHSYHNKCIKKWVKENRTCPICKISIAHQ